MTEQIITQVKRVIVGKDDVIGKILMAILASGHILLEDVPGVGITTMALAFARTMGLENRRVQFTPDTMSSDITGFSVYNKETSGLEYKPGAAFCNLLLADEINRTSPKTQAALLEVMEEQSVTVDGVTHKLPTPFICIATQNPIGSAGTQNLPESQLDRFMVRLSMGYPTLEHQIEIIKNRQAADPLTQVEPVVTAPQLLELRGQAAAVFAHDDVIRYAAQLCMATREHADVEQGVSPRAVLALVRMAKAHAMVRGRDFLIPEDVQAVFIDVCCHRIRLSAQARIRGARPQAVLEGLLAAAPAPAINRI